MIATDLFSSPPAQSFWFGLLSAASLPLGAALGIWLKPPKIAVAAIMAFGAGSLIAALTLELVAPAFAHAGFWPLALGAIVGGCLFEGLNQFLNGKGAFLRKPATLMRHVIRIKRSRIRGIVEHLAKVDVFRALPPAEVKSIVQHIHRREFEPGTVIFNQGDAGDSLYLMGSGTVEVVKDDEAVATLTGGDSFGEMALLTGEDRNATLRTVTPVVAWQILKHDFDSLAKVSPGLLEALEALGEQRVQDPLGHDLLSGRLRTDAWRDEVNRHLRSASVFATERDARQAVHARRAGGAALAMWLGILLDGIPESAVIGASMTRASVSWALILGLFLANLPESMSSAVGMRKQGTSIRKIMVMWGSLMFLTGIGALLGKSLLAGSSHVTFALFEGCAAGAMLVMVAETMLPEAYEQGGPIVGMATLIGFLSCIFVKSLG